MYVTQTNACTVPNSATPVSQAVLDRAATRRAAQDAQAAKFLQSWISLLDRTPESFAGLRMPPAQFTQAITDVADEVLALDRSDNNRENTALYRSGAVCNPSGDGPEVIPLNGFASSMPDTQPLDLMAKGPIGPVYKSAGGNGMGCAGDNCGCGGKCGGARPGMGGVFTGPGSAVLWGSIAAAGFLMQLISFNKPARRRRR